MDLNSTHPDRNPGTYQCLGTSLKDISGNEAIFDFDSSGSSCCRNLDAILFNRSISILFVAKTEEVESVREVASCAFFHQVFVLLQWRCWFDPLSLSRPDCRPRRLVKNALSPRIAGSIAIDNPRKFKVAE